MAIYNRNILQSLAIAFSMLAFLITPNALMAGEQPNVLIMGEDADKDTVPRHSRVFNRVLNALVSELSQKGFKVYDETGVSLNITNPGRVRRTDAELVTVARRVKNPPLDVIASFQIYAFANKNAYSDIYDLSVRVAGRMMHVQTSKRLGNFEVAMGPTDLSPLPVNCNRDCILENVGKHAKEIAHEVGIVLAEKLDMISPKRSKSTTTTTTDADTDTPDDVVRTTTDKCSGLTTAYSLRFEGFKSDEVTMIEEFVRAFKGFDHMRPVRVNLRTAEYWYETCSDSARLNRNIRLMLESMEVKARLALNGNRFKVTKIGRPETR